MSSLLPNKNAQQAKMVTDSLLEDGMLVHKQQSFSKVVVLNVVKKHFERCCMMMHLDLDVYIILFDMHMK